jgi:nitrogen regulatory protein PII 2
MKEIIAIIRPKKVGTTKNALEKLGFPSMTAIPVLGRGKQKGIADEVAIEIRPELLTLGVKSGGMKYIPKRLLSVVVRNDDVDTVITTLVSINQTGQVGDGKIFICPIDDAVRVRTDEHGENAVL